jgi:hypothetical protein
MDWSHGNLAAPSGIVPGDDEVDPERTQGLDGVLVSLLKVLSVKMQGPVCNSCVFLGPVVISSVSVSVAINIALCSKKNVVLHFMVWLYI